MNLNIIMTFTFKKYYKLGGGVYLTWYAHLERQPTPVFLPGESQGRGSLVGCRLWGRRESDTTEAT